MFVPCGKEKGQPSCLKVGYLWSISHTCSRIPLGWRTGSPRPQRKLLRPAVVRPEGKGTGTCSRRAQLWILFAPGDHLPWWGLSSSSYKFSPGKESNPNSGETGFIIRSKWLWVDKGQSVMDAVVCCLVLWSGPRHSLPQRLSMLVTKNS